MNVAYYNQYLTQTFILETLFLSCYVPPGNLDFSQTPGSTLQDYSGIGYSRMFKQEEVSTAEIKLSV